ncbi:MAG: hypothetical protein ABFD75_10855 [Smithella sp.]
MSLKPEEKEILDALKNLFIQVYSQQFQISALLHVSDRKSLSQVKEFLEEQAENEDYKGINAEALHDAQQIVSLFCDNDQPDDPGKLFHLIPGGKEE